ncbi:MAG: hypothetical protein ACXW2E_01335 [Nitrososphaeraceae archaeon]
MIEFVCGWMIIGCILYHVKFNNVDMDCEVSLSLIEWLLIAPLLITAVAILFLMFLVKHHH